MSRNNSKNVKVLAQYCAWNSETKYRIEFNFGTSVTNDDLLGCAKFHWEQTTRHPEKNSIIFWNSKLDELFQFEFLRGIYNV